MRLCPTPDSRSVAFPLFLTPAAPPFSPECSRCWEAIPYQLWETAFLSPLGVFFVLNLKLLDQAAFHLWIFGAFCAVKKSVKLHTGLRDTAGM